jgi:hypothetical protein
MPLRPIDRMRDMRAKALVVLLIGVAAVTAAERVRSQSLGEVAKKEQERRKNTPSSGKVYTNKDLAPAPTPSADATAGTEPAGSVSKPADQATPPNEKPAAGDAAGKKAGDSDKGADKGPSGAKDQAYWSSRHKTLQEALDRDSTFAEALQSRINALTTDFVNRDDPAQRTVIERDRQKAAAELDRLKKQISDDRKALADFEEEARRAGVPPGWLR